MIGFSRKNLRDILFCTASILVLLLTCSLMAMGDASFSTSVSPVIAPDLKELIQKIAEHDASLLRSRKGRDGIFMKMLYSAWDGFSGVGPHTARLSLSELKHFLLFSQAGQALGVRDGGLDRLVVNEGLGLIPDSVILRGQAKGLDGVRDTQIVLRRGKRGDLDYAFAIFDPVTGTMTLRVDMEGFEMRISPSGDVNLKAVCHLVRDELARLSDQELEKWGVKTEYFPFSRRVNIRHPRFTQCSYAGKVLSTSTPAELTSFYNMEFARASAALQRREPVLNQSKRMARRSALLGDDFVPDSKSGPPAR